MSENVVQGFQTNRGLIVPGSVTKVDVDSAGAAAAAYAAAAADLAAHEAASNPHPVYLTTAEGNAAYDPLGAAAAAQAASEPTIPAGTTAQYWRGDKSWQTLDKAAVGLGNVDNTADSAKPVSTAQQAAIDAAVVGLFDPKGPIDCSANPNYPAALAGDNYRVTVAGKIGGASGVNVSVGDLIIAAADNAGGTQGAVGSSWYILEANIPGLTVVGAAMIALATPAAASFPRINNDGTVTERIASEVRTDLALGSLATASTVTEAMQTLADNTTQDVTIIRHGYVPKAPNDAAQFLNGVGAWSVPGVPASSIGSDQLILPNQVFGA